MSLIATKISSAAADNFRFLKGKYVTSADGNGDYIAFEIPRFAFINYVALDVKTALTAGTTGDITIGVKVPGTAINDSRIADNLVTLPEATGVKVIPVGIYLETGGVVTIGVTKGDSAADFVGRLFINFTVIH